MGTSPHVFTGVPLLQTLKPVTLFLALLIATTAARGERLKIAPEDLKLRVRVSQRLSPSVRLRLRDLAASSPLPVEGGVPQTDRILEEEFGSLDGERKQLLRYYFLVTRMEKSREFSEEFGRRKDRYRRGVELLEQYIETLNRLIAQAVFREAEQYVAPERFSFPLGQVLREESGALRVVRPLPAPDLSLGRANLRRIRTVAASDRDLLEARLSDIDVAERAFLAEASQLGQQLVQMRHSVMELVGRDGAGLPFAF